MIARLAARVLATPLAVGIAIDDHQHQCAIEARDAIVILGAPLTARGDVSAVLHERIDVGLRLWRAGGSARLIVTGGTTRGAGRSEAAAMADCLRRAGVPEAAIAIEDQALSTADNAARVHALDPSLRTVWIATQRFHTRRAVRLFACHGLAARAAYRSDGLERREPRRALRWVAREYAAWLRVGLRVLTS